MPTTTTLSAIRSPMTPKSMTPDSHCISMVSIPELFQNIPGSASIPGLAFRPSEGQADLHQSLGPAVVALGAVVGAVAMGDLRLEQQQPRRRIFVTGVI